MHNDLDFVPYYFQKPLVIIAVISLVLLIIIQWDNGIKNEGIKLLLKTITVIILILLPLCFILYLYPKESPALSSMSSINGYYEEGYAYGIRIEESNWKEKRLIIIWKEYLDCLFY